MGLEERTQHAGPRPERPHARADWRQMLGIGAIASILGIAAGLLIDWFPVAASDEAKPIDTLWDVLIIFSVPVFVGVTVVVLFSVWKFRMRPGEENLDGPPIHGNTRLEVIWTAIPAIVLVGLCTYAFVVLEDVEAADSNPVKVRVVGEQFAWTFFYKQADGKEVASRQLHVPLNRQVAVHAPVQGRAARLLGARLPHEEGRGARDRRHVLRDAEPARRLPDRVRRAVRARARGHALDRRRRRAAGLRRAGWPSSASPPRRGRRRRDGGSAARPTARRSSPPRPTAPRATRWPTRARRARSGRIWTRSSPTRTRPSSRSRSSIPTR